MLHSSFKKYQNQTAQKAAEIICMLSVNENHVHSQTAVAFFADLQVKSPLGFILSSNNEQMLKANTHACFGFIISMLKNLRAYSNFEKIAHLTSRIY